MGCSGGRYINDNYDNYSIGCFSGNGKVQLANKTYKK